MRSILLLWGCLTSFVLLAQSNADMVSEDMPALSLTKGSQALSENVTATTKYINYRESANTLIFSLTIENTGKPGTLLKVKTTNLRVIPGLRANKNGHDIGRPKINEQEFHTVPVGGRLTLSGRVQTTLEDVRIDWGDNIQSYTINKNKVETPPTPPTPPSKPSKMVSEGMPALSLTRGSQALSDNATAGTNSVNYRRNTLTFSLTIQNMGKAGTLLKVTTTDLKAIPGLRANKNGHDIGELKMDQYGFFNLSAGERITLSGRLNTTLEDVRIDWGDHIQSRAPSNTLVKVETPPAPPSAEQNGYQGRKNCPEPSTNQSYFSNLKKQIKEELTDFTKIDVAQEGVKGRCFSTDQIIELVQLFSSDSSKLKFAKAAFSATYDADNYHKIVDLLTFSSKKEELRNFIR